MKNEILSLKETNLKLEEQVKNLNEENENNKQKLSKYESGDDNISKEDLINKNKSLEEENKKLNQKLSNLKQSVLQLNERLEKDIYGKLESKTKLLKNSLQINEQLQKKIEGLQEENEKFKSIDEELKIYREKFDNLLKDKIEMENFHIKQENTIKGLENEIGQLNSEIEDKDIKYKQLDKSYLSIIRVIEEHKKTISKLQDQLNKKQIEDKNLRNQIYEKEQEISLLRSFINSIKYENRMNNFQNSLSARQSAKKKNKNNDSQNLILPKINSAYGNKQLQTNNDNNNNFENNLNYNNVLTEDDPEEENMKGINNLMNKILNE